MKKRQTNKILKRIGTKLYKKLDLTPLEERVFTIVKISKANKTLDNFRSKEYEAGTIYDEGFIERVRKLYEDVLSIKNITGVKEVTK